MEFLNKGFQVDFKDKPRELRNNIGLLAPTGWRGDKSPNRPRCGDADIQRLQHLSGVSLGWPSEVTPPSVRRSHHGTEVIPDAMWPGLDRLSSSTLCVVLMNRGQKGFMGPMSPIWDP